MKSRLIIADDHQVVRQGLREVISRLPDMTVVGEASDGCEAERLARECPADLLILDLALPGRRGVDVLQALRGDGIRIPVIFFSMYPAAQYLDFVRRGGAQGFVGKDSDTGELIRAVRRVLAGGTCFPRSPGLSGGMAAEENPFARLSRREAEILEGLLQGVSLLEIAARLNIGAKSVSTYRRRLLDKLGVESNAELVALAARHGYV